MRILSKRHQILQEYHNHKNIRELDMRISENKMQQSQNEGKKIGKTNTKDWLFYLSRLSAAVSRVQNQT